jgi:hypothetical protein
MSSSATHPVHAQGSSSAELSTPVRLSNLRVEVKDPLDHSGRRQIDEVDLIDGRPCARVSSVASSAISGPSLLGPAIPPAHLSRQPPVVIAAVSVLLKAALALLRQAAGRQRQ